MSTYKIVVDSCCEIPEEIKKEINFIPLENANEVFDKVLEK